jgi:hypothetical protein
VRTVELVFWTGSLARESEQAVVAGKGDSLSIKVPVSWDMGVFWEVVGGGCSAGDFWFGSISSTWGWGGWMAVGVGWGAGVNCASAVLAWKV